MPRRFIIDTDTASDDAVALIMALQSPDVVMEAVTIVAGNVPVEQGSINARFIAELCDVDVPVYEGCGKPLERDAHDAKFFHGPDGMGGMNYPPPARPAAGTDAVGELGARFRDSPEEITLVTLGPLTNVATALQREPRLARQVRECFVMGGAACTVGNITPAAEYNIWCDPEAARVVFDSGMDITMIGWELCRGEANLSDADMERALALGTRRARVAIDCNRSGLAANREWLGDPGMSLPDPVAMAVALDPTIAIEKSAHRVDIACDDELTRGMTVVDRLGVTGKTPNAVVCWSIDVDRWKAALFAALA